LARNGPELDVDAVVVVALAATVVVLELPVLLELPQPATASATPTRARIDVLGTGYLLWFGVTDKTAFLLASPPRPESRDPFVGSAAAINARPAIRRACLYDSAISGFLPARFWRLHKDPSWAS
jgi:hypothetical protein